MRNKKEFRDDQQDEEESSQMGPKPEGDSGIQVSLASITQKSAKEIRDSYFASTASSVAFKGGQQPPPSASFAVESDDGGAGEEEKSNNRVSQVAAQVQ